MKNKKVCPKCGNRDIIIVEGYKGAYGTGNNIQVGLTTLSAVPVDSYVCRKCGYSEEWIRPEDIERVRRSRHAKEC